MNDDKEDSIEENEPWCEPEDCDECGFPAGDFGDEDCICGVWRCPECGAVQ